MANHGKGEVDHVAGLVKVAMRMAVASEQIFHVAADTVDYLSSKDLIVSIKKFFQTI